MRLSTLLLTVTLTSSAAFADTQVVDSAGREVVVNEPPTKILCLLGDCIHHLAVLGLAPALASESDIIAASENNVLGANTSDVDTFLWPSDGPDFERLIAFEPDLMVLDARYLINDAAFEPLKQTIPYYASRGPYPLLDDIDLETEEGWQRFTLDLMNFGTMLELEREAKSFVDSLRDRYDAYHSLIDGEARYSRVRIHSDDNSIWAPQCPRLLARLGECIDFGGEWTEVTVEALLTVDPEVLFVENSSDKELVLEDWSSVPLWNELSAVKDGRVHILRFGSFHDATPLSLFNALDAMVPALYPGVFSGPLTDQEVTKLVQN